MADYDYVTKGNDDGSIMGQSSTEKIGFYGATPVVRQTTAVTPTDLATAITAIGAIKTALTNLGLTN